MIGPEPKKWVCVIIDHRSMFEGVYGPFDTEDEAAQYAAGEVDGLTVKTFTGAVACHILELKKPDMTGR